MSKVSSLLLFKCIEVLSLETDILQTFCNVDLCYGILRDPQHTERRSSTKKRRTWKIFVYQELKIFLSPSHSFLPFATPTVLTQLQSLFIKMSSRQDTSFNGSVHAQAALRAARDAFFVAGPSEREGQNIAVSLGNAHPHMVSLVLILSTFLFEAKTYY